MTKYDEIMEKITLSPEARDRIIDNLTEELSSEKGYVPVRVGRTRSKAWRKYITAVACCILVVCGALAAARSEMFMNLMDGGSSDSVEESEYSNELDTGSDSGATDSKSADVSAEAEGNIDSYTAEDGVDEQAALAYDVIAGSEEDLSERLGFDMSCPSFREVCEKAGLTEVSYGIIGESIGEVSYSDGEKRNWLRKAIGTEDISGDHNLYDVEMVIDGKDRSGTLKGEMNDYKLAVWTTADGFTYAAYVEDGLTDTEWQEIIDNK